MENVYDSGHINSVWENVTDHIHISDKDSLDQFERKQYKTWIDEKAEKFLDQRNQANLMFVGPCIIVITEE